MLAVIRYEEPDLEMPPDEPLPEGERAVLERWIAAGAPWTKQEETPEDIESARFFEQSIRPLLAERCFECHGPEPPRAQGRLEDDRARRALGWRTERQARSRLEIRKRAG